MSDNRTQQQLDFLTHPEKLEEVSKRGVFKWGQKIFYLYPLSVFTPFGFASFFTGSVADLFMAGSVVALFFVSMLGLIDMSLRGKIEKSIGMKADGNIFDKLTAEYKLEVVEKLEKNQALLAPTLYAHLLQIMAQKPTSKLWWASLDDYLKNTIEVHNETVYKKEWIAKSLELQKSSPNIGLTSPVTQLLSTDKDIGLQ